MSVVIPAVVLVALIGLLAKRLHRARAEDPLQVRRPVPTFRVVALGQQGSGKTLLLAGMYHALRVPADQSYFLTTRPDDAVRLNGWFSQMADTATQAWPSGTAKGETRRFTFAVRTRTSGAVSTVFDLDYLEYAGELLTELQESGSTSKEELQEQVRSADALIGIIDGYGIRRYIDGRPDGAMLLAETLNALVPAITVATCPVTFVITKWDLLTDLHRDEDTRLSLVRDLLMSNAQFRALVGVHDGERVVRLIPVSAVGPGFARMGAAGEILKVAQGEVHPTNVDIPLSAVVPDLFEQVENRLDEETRAALHAEIRRRSLMDPLDALASLAVFTGQTAGRLVLATFGGPATAVVGESVLSLFIDSRTEATNMERELSDAEQIIDQTRRARRRVVQDMRAKLIRLESRLPSSRLSDGR